MSPADEPPELKVLGNVPITEAFFVVGSTPATWNQKNGRGREVPTFIPTSNAPTERYFESYPAAKARGTNGESETLNFSGFIFNFA